MASNKMHESFKRKLIAAAVVSYFSANPASANPNGATVASGSATFSTSGNTLTVTNTPNAIINWASFSINANETVKFLQQSSASAVLNRVTGSNPSQILGALQSNGKVFLINPNGIMFGANARVDVNGLIASTLNITDSDFLNGKLRFNADRQSIGGVTNAGQITTPNGGFVYLIAPNIENSGVITTPSGEAILAAGNSVEIVDSTDPTQRVLVSATSQDVNLSQMMTQSGGNIFKMLNSGKISANTAVKDATGKIFLKSAGDIQTTSTSVIEAAGNSAANGGSIRSFADGAGIYAGTFNVSGKNGGFLETSGEYLEVNDANIILKALSSSGSGGTWLLDPSDIEINSSGYGCAAGASCIGASTITSALRSGNVVFTTSSDSNGNGNITVDSSATISGSSGHTLTLDADQDITISGSIHLTSSGTGSGDLFLTASRNVEVTGTGVIQADNVSIDATSGTVTVNSSGSVTAHASASGVSAILSIDAANITINGTTASASSYGGASTSFNAANMIRVGSSGSITSSSSATGTTASVSLTASNISNNGQISSSASDGLASTTLSATNTISNTNQIASFSNANAFTELDASNISLGSGSNISAGSYGTGFAETFIVGDSLNLAGNITADASGDTSTVGISGSTISLNNAYVAATGGVAETELVSNNYITISSSTVSTSGTTTGSTIIITEAGDIQVNNSSLFANSEMLISTGGHLFLTNSSSIEVTSPNTLLFDFPLLGSNGWFIDGVANSFGSIAGSGCAAGSSCIIVNGTTPILGSTFFTTYGGLNTVANGAVSGTVGTVNNDILTSTSTNPILTDNSNTPTTNDFFNSGTSSEEGQTTPLKEQKPENAETAGTTGSTILGTDHSQQDQNEKPQQCS